MKKHYFIFAAALMALASCSTDDFIGNNGQGNVQGTGDAAIRFDGGTGKITRATSNTASSDADKLDNQFKIYGVKASSNGQYSKVFVDYWLWSSTNKTTSNTKDWEYVADKGAVNIGADKTALDKNQTIKYWDYSSANYHFVAGSPVKSFEYKLNDNGDIESATVKDLAGHINPSSETNSKLKNPEPVYVAEPKNVTKDNYQEAVQFNFVRQQSKVRVGIYETIPGYKISSIKFYTIGDNGKFVAPTNDEGNYPNNVTLASTTANYFIGVKEENEATGTITYDWTKTTPTYTFSYDNTVVAQQNWFGGKFTNGVPATTSTVTTKVNELFGTDGDMGDNGYFTVMPTPSATTAAPILIKCDYTLTSTDGSNETINVTGATAAIPAAFSKWNTNTQYTYLFKISQNTNGTTGTGTPGDPDSPTGLYPITFDAVVANVQDGNNQGTTTTVAIPSITTNQVGSVTDAGIVYKVGTPITVTVTDNENGSVLSLNKTDNTKGKVAVYKLVTKANEADLQINAPTGQDVSEETITDNVLTFTPDATGWYAIQYLQTPSTTNTDGQTSPAVYVYKVVYVGATASK